MATKPNIVLVHGAWADGSSWSKVIPLLKEAGFNTIATQQKLTSLADDAEIVRRAAESLAGPVSACRPFLRRCIITESAQFCPNVAGLVYHRRFRPGQRRKSFTLIIRSSCCTSRCGCYKAGQIRISLDRPETVC